MGVRAQAEAALRDLIDHYDRGGEPERAAVRALLSRRTSFRRDVT
ncbi:hypothetical protein [Streptomyces cyaneochromogenes]|nr:hypothetical protein [Streptomyces cyaneochromogenes]